MEQQWFLGKKTQFSVKWRGLLDVTAVELLSWICHIEKASFLYFYTSITLIMSWRTLHHKDADSNDRTCSRKHSFAAWSTCTNHTGHNRQKEIPNEYLLNVLIVETSCQFLASRRPTQTRPNESLVFIFFLVLVLCPKLAQPQKIKKI